MENLKIRSRNTHSSGDRDRGDGYGPTWLPSPPTLTLSSGHVHIWLVRLDRPGRDVQQLAQSLIEDEHKRAERFYFKRDKNRFIVRRAVLRMILGRYLQIEPNQIQFAYGPHGKPFLAERLCDSSLRFNLAHSHELSLYAFSHGREIGIDLEHCRALPDAEQIAARFFSARENATLQTLATSQRQKAFFNCWTRKEAYIKAIGKGLTLPLDQFDVSLAPGESASLLNAEGAFEEASRWSLKALTPAPGYVAALAVEGYNWHLNCWQFPESTSEVLNKQ